jgi:molybdopterin converting factor small subunit
MAAEVTIRFFGGAARAAGAGERRLHAATVGAAREHLSASPELAKVCAVSSFLVDGVLAGDDTALHEGAVVDVLPPFAGG